MYHGDGADHDGNDGQNCINAWPFLADHGMVYHGNKCLLPKSNNLFGLIAGGCDCPGSAKSTPWHKPGDPNPNGECGVSFANNQYYTHNGSAVASQCGDFATKWKAANEPDSTIGVLPSDDVLMGWARDLLQMK